MKERSLAVRCKDFENFLFKLPLNSQIYQVLRESPKYNPKETERVKARLFAYYHILRAVDTEKEAFELIKLAELYGVLEGELTARLEEALKSGEGLNYQDLDLMKEMRQLLVEKYKLKHGEKRMQISAKLSYKDFLEALNEDEKPKEKDV